MSDQLIRLEDALAIIEAEDNDWFLLGHNAPDALRACRAALEALPARDLPAILDDAAREHVGEILFEPGAEPEDDCLLCDLATAFEIWQEFGFEPPETPDPTPDGYLRWGDDGNGNPSLWEIRQVAIQPAGHALMVGHRAEEPG